MPNHVTNIIVIGTGVSEAQAVLKKIASGDSPIDFNQIIPMPESLNITSGTSTDRAMAVILAEEHGDYTGIDEMLAYDWVKRSVTINSREDLVEYLKNDKDTNLELGRIAVNNIKQYGHSDWYGWCCANWGTKWNAYNYSIHKNIITFDTAWSNPYPVLIELSKQFPDIMISVQYADEDFGSNCGEYDLLNGEVIHENIPEACNLDSIVLALNVQGNSTLESHFCDDYVEYYQEEFEEDVEDEADNKYIILLALAGFKTEAIPNEIEPCDEAIEPLIKLATRHGYNTTVELLRNLKLSRNMEGNRL